MSRLSVVACLCLFGCPDHSFEDAKRLEADGKLAEAGELFRTLAEETPANIPAWDGAIDVYCRRLVQVSECTNILDLELKVLGNVDRHREALAEVLELRARSRLDQGMASDALEDLKRAEKASPWRATIYPAMAKAYVALGDRTNAEVAIRKAREIDPHQAEANAIAAELPTEEGFGGAAD